jgi:phage tail sheath gpL-like
MKNTTIELVSIYGMQTKQGLVELIINGVKTQMTISKAKEVSEMLHGAIEAAISDELIVKFLTQKVGFDEMKAAQVLLDFRELRQGSRKTVFPS